MFDKYLELKDKGKTPALVNVIIEATPTSPVSDVIKMTYQRYDSDTGVLSEPHEETLNTEELKRHIKTLKARLAAAREVYNLATGKVPE